MALDLWRLPLLDVVERVGTVRRANVRRPAVVTMVGRAGRLPLGQQTGDLTRGHDAVVAMITRDPWADARAVVTQPVLDPDVAAVRTRLRIRRALGLAFACAVLIAVVLLIPFVIDPALGDLWRVPRHVMWGGFALAGLGFVLMVVGAARTAGAARPFVGPGAFLDRADRAWLRAQIAENRPVSEERWEVAADTARRMAEDGRYLPTYLGLVILYAGMIVASPLPGLLVLFSAAISFTLVRAVLEAVWSRRARRWLAQNA